MRIAEEIGWWAMVVSTVFGGIVVLGVVVGKGIRIMESDDE